MRRNIICTTGTSLLTNPDRPWSPWRRGDELPSLNEMLKWLTSADLQVASAESNTLSALLLNENDRLCFLHSATPEGRLCAAALKEFYKAEKFEIGELGYGEKSFTSGLKGLVDLVIRLIRKARERGETPLLSATGGFKAEIAFLNLLGALLEVEVVYMHERFREPVQLPRLPLRWDEEFVTKHEDFFCWIDAEPRSSIEVESWLKGRPELRGLVEDDGEGHTFLSAAGDLLFKAAKDRKTWGPRVTWPEPDSRPPEEKNKVSKVPHHRPRKWREFVERLCRIDCVSMVMFDPSAPSGARVKVHDPLKGEIHVRLVDSESVLPLKVVTTARGVEQCEHVASYLESRR